MARSRPAEHDLVRLRTLVDALPNLFHDLNNHLNRINLATAHLQRKVADGPEKERLEIVRKEVRAAAEAIRWWQAREAAPVQTGRCDLKQALLQAVADPKRPFRIEEKGEQLFLPFVEEDLVSLLHYLVGILDPDAKGIRAGLHREEDGATRLTLHPEVPGPGEPKALFMREPADRTLEGLAAATLLRRMQATLAKESEGPGIVVTWTD